MPASAAPSAAQLRDAMVNQLIELGVATDPRIQHAFRTVPRHLGIPEADMARVYNAERSVVTKTDAAGVNVSSVSAPRVQAMQIQQADIQPGMRVLEIGSGGVNAAYLAEMVTDTGKVVTLDIDPEITRRARAFLKATGYSRTVTVLTGDAEYGAPGHGPFDRIVVTVQAADIPPAWREQLVDGGRLVVPLRMRSMTRSVAFVRHCDTLVSDGLELCGFVPMQGAGENRMRLAYLHDVQGEEVALRLDGHPEPDLEALRAALHMPPVAAWSGVTVAGDESMEYSDFYLMSAFDGVSVLAGSRGARDRGIIPVSAPIGTPALVDGDSFAYRRPRRTRDPDRWELGAIGHGPHGRQVADRLAEGLRTWDRKHRGHLPRIEVHPADTPDERLPAGRRIDRRHSRVLITWP